MGLYTHTHTHTYCLLLLILTGRNKYVYTLVGEQQKIVGNRLQRPYKGKFINDQAHKRQKESKEERERESERDTREKVTLVVGGDPLCMATKAPTKRHARVPLGVSSYFSDISRQMPKKTNYNYKKMLLKDAERDQNKYMKKAPKSACLIRACGLMMSIQMAHGQKKSQKKT